MSDDRGLDAVGEPQPPHNGGRTVWLGWATDPTPPRPAWFTDLLELMIDGPGPADTIDGVVEKRVLEDDKLLDFRYRIQRRGTLTRCTTLTGEVHYIAGPDRIWCRGSDDQEIQSEPRTRRGWFHTPDDYEFGAYRESRERWAGTDFTTPVGEARHVLYLRRDALEFDLAPPAHKGGSPLTITVDQQTGLVLNQNNSGWGTHSRWIELELDAELPDSLFHLHESDTIARHDY